MKKIASVCMAMLLMLGAAFAVPLYKSVVAANSTNMLQNGDFETDIAVPAYSLAQAKAAFANGSIQGQWFTGGNETFGKGAEIVTDGTGHAMQAGKWLTQQLVGVEKDKTYTVTFKVKGVEGDNGKLLCHVNRFNYASDKAREYSLYARSFEAGERADDVAEAPDKDPAYTYALYEDPENKNWDRGMIIPTAEWKTYSFTFTMSENVPENTAVLLQFWHFGGSKVLLDDVSVEDRGVIILQNGDFESSTALPAYNLTQAKAAFANGSIKGQWFTGAETRFGKGAEVVANGDGHAMQAGNWLTQQLVGIKKGYTYTVSFKAKGVEGDKGKLLCHVNRFNYASDKARDYSLYARSFEAGERADDVKEAPDKDPAYTYALYVDPENKNWDRGMIVPTAEWKTYSFTFTMTEDIPQNTAVLLQFWHFGGSKVLLDDVVVEDLGINLTTTAGAGGSAAVSNRNPKEGEAVQFTATPNSDYKFAGWFQNDGTTLVSKENPYNITATEGMELHAAFQFAPSDADQELLADGGFDTTKEVLTPKDGEMQTYDSAHLWYKPWGSTKVTSDLANKCMELNTWIYQSVKIKDNSEYILRFQAKTSKPATVNAFFRALTNYDVTPVAKRIKLQDDGKWHDYAVTMSVEDLNQSYPAYVLGLEKEDAAVLIDDLSLKEKTANDYIVKATAYRCGSVQQSKQFARGGDQVTLTAVPDENATFLGWYQAGNVAGGPVSKATQLTVTVRESMEFIAAFGGNGYPESFTSFLNEDFENGTITGWRAGSDDCSMYLQSEGAHSGKNAIAFDFDATKNNRLYIGTDNGVLLAGDCTYTISYWFKTDDNAGLRVRPIFYTDVKYREGITDLVHYDRNIRQDLPVTHQFGLGDMPYTEVVFYSSIKTKMISKYYPEAEDGWCYYSATFELPLEYDGTIVYLGLQGREGTGTICIDDLKIEAQQPDRSTRQAGPAYCAYLYNSFRSGNFEQALSQSNFSQLSSGAKIATGNAAEGKQFLKIGKYAGATVIPLSTAKGVNYVAYSIQANSSGTSYIGLMNELPGTQAAYENPATAGIEFFRVPKTNGWVRQSIAYYVQKANTPKYLVIFGGSNDFSIDYLQVFAQKFHYAEDPNLCLNSIPSYDYDGIGLTEDRYDRMYSNTYIMETNPTPVQNNGAASAQNPQTGAKQLTPVLIILTSAALFTVLCCKKKKEVRL